MLDTISIMINDGVLDGIIFGGITGVIEGFIYYHLVYKSNRTNVKITKYILQQCEEQKITIHEFVERNKEKQSIL